MNGDGLGDLVVGNGRDAWIVWGTRAGGEIDLAHPGLAATELLPPAGELGLGDVVAGMGDVNGDGLADVAVGNGTSSSRSSSAAATAPRSA